MESTGDAARCWLLCHTRLGQSGAIEGLLGQALRGEVLGVG